MVSRVDHMNNYTDAGQRCGRPLVKNLLLEKSFNSTPPVTQLVTQGKNEREKLISIGFSDIPSSRLKGLSHEN